MFEALKNSVPERLEGEAPPLIPAPVAYTVAYAMPILFQPEHPMYPHLTSWIIRNASFELKVSPKPLSLSNRFGKLTLSFSLCPSSINFLRRPRDPCTRNAYGCSM